MDRKVLEELCNISITIRGLGSDPLGRVNGNGGNEKKERICGTTSEF